MIDILLVLVLMIGAIGGYWVGYVHGREDEGDIRDALLSRETKDGRS